MTSITPGKTAATREFGKYRVLATIARGGMAYVHLAASRGDQGFTKVVVVKEMLEELSADPSFRTMFAQEARVAAQLSHPNIVTTFEADAQSERLYMVMEYLDGQPLNRVKKKFDATSYFPHYLHVFCNVLEALSYAHGLRGYDGAELKIVHRDVTPHNVFITYAGEVKLVDFGIAKVVRPGADTKVGVVKGKLAYMPPEQARGITIDHRADLFSVGVMLWEAYTQRRLWAAIEEVDVLRMLLEGRLPDINEGLGNAPKALVDVIRRALAPNAADRYESADAMKRDLDAFRRTLSVIPERGDLGRLVAEHFSNERGQSNALIREQLALASSVATGEYVAQSFTGIGGNANPFAPDVSGRFVPDDAVTIGTPPAASMESIASQNAPGGGIKRGLAAFTIILSLGVAVLFGWLILHGVRDRGAPGKTSATLASTNVASAPLSQALEAVPSASASTAITASASAVVSVPIANVSASAAPAVASVPRPAAPPPFIPRWTPPVRKATPAVKSSAAGNPSGGVDLGY